MIWIDIVISLVLIFSFIGGLKEGAVKSFFSLLGLFICIPLTGLTYPYLFNLLAAISDATWRGFISFLVTFVIISIILALIFLIPGKLLSATWNKGVLNMILGGCFSLVGAAISITIFSIVVQAYPVFDWLDYAVTHSNVINWLMNYLGFIKLMLPQTFHSLAMSVRF
ncbi:MAG TPA: CvpA family protein [Dehalococcoidia bacterium]|nr:CvpA family protein [Dehalococcoidia bacterium]